MGFGVRSAVTGPGGLTARSTLVVLNGDEISLFLGGAGRCPDDQSMTFSDEL